MPLPVVVVANLGIVEVGDAALGRGRRHGASVPEKGEKREAREGRLRGCAARGHRPCTSWLRRLRFPATERESAEPCRVYVRA